MKKITLLLFSMYCGPLLSINFAPSLKQHLKTIAAIYGNHLLLDGIHSMGHGIAAHVGLFLKMQETVPGKGANAFKIITVPKTNIPLAIEYLFPNFKNKSFIKCIELSGPAAGLLACYIQLKLANIYSEYSSEKPFIQNIKSGLSKPFYKGHSTSTMTIVGLHALKNSCQLIPGAHNSLEKD